MISGIIGGRLYHVITTPGPYWGEGGHPVDALKIWNGGLGIWGAVALGARRRLDRLPPQRRLLPRLRRRRGARHRLRPGHRPLGNWFNNELYGAPTDLPWGLHVHEWDHGTGRAVVDAAGRPGRPGVFHPTFLYESLFLVVLATALLVLDRRRRLHPGPVFGLYVAGYPVGRIVVEKMRTDEAELISASGSTCGRASSSSSSACGSSGSPAAGRRGTRSGREAADPEVAADNTEDVEDGAAVAPSEPGAKSQDVG